MFKLKYALLDIEVIPDDWDIDKWIKYMDTMHILFVKNGSKSKEIEIDVSFWKWLKFKFFNK